MSSANDNPTQYIKERMIEPLRAFRNMILPLNQTHNTSAQECTDLLLGLLLGNDGQVAMQGPASDQLANLLGQFIDAEWPLSSDGPYIQGTSPPATLEGRMLEVAQICEKAASELEENLPPLTAAPSSSSLADGGSRGEQRQRGYQSHFRNLSDQIYL